MEYSKDEFSLQKKMNQLAELGRVQGGQPVFEAAWQFIEVCPEKLRHGLVAGVNEKGSLIVMLYVGMNNVFLSFVGENDEDIRVHWFLEGRTGSTEAVNFIVSEEDIHRVLRAFEWDLKKYILDPLESEADQPYPYVQ